MTAGAGFELQPILPGQLVTLRPLLESDFAELFAAASDPLIWEQHPEPDRYTEDVFRRYFAGAIESGGAFAILDTRTGRVIGSSRYHGFDPARSEIEIGWTFLKRAYWGGRYNAAVKRLMLDHAFRFVERVIFLVGPANLRSQRAVEKIGARRTSTVVREGLESIVFEIARDHWRTG